LLIAVGLGQLWAFDALDGRKPFGDENQYAAQAFKHREGWRGLVPGNLPLVHRPALNGQVLALAVVEGSHGRRNTGGAPGLLHRARYLYLCLFMITLIAVYAQGRLMGLVPGWAVLAAGLLACLPRVAFHVHSMWSETLHMALESMAFAFILAYFATRRTGWLAIAGVAFGYAMFARTTLNGFVPVTCALLFWHGLRGGSQPRALRRAAAAAVPVLVFVILLTATVGPQLAANVHDGKGLRLSANVWRNLEWGFRSRVPGEQSGLTWPEHKRLYQSSASERPLLHATHAINLELHAKRRSLEFLDSRPWYWHAKRQVPKAVDRLWNGESMLFRAVTEGFWRARAATLAPVLPFDRAMWRVLCLIGVVGCVVLGVRGWSYALHATFACYYAIAFCAAPVSARVAIQVAPTLCLFAVVLLASLGRSLRQSARFRATRQPAASLAHPEVADLGSRPLPR
jgi:hypothetical protein